MGSNCYITDKATRWVLISDGPIDKAFEINGDKPVAFGIRLQLYWGHVPGPLIDILCNENSLLLLRSC